jgi:hypothetical protein
VAGDLHAQGFQLVLIADCIEYFHSFPLTRLFHISQEPFVSADYRHIQRLEEERYQEYMKRCGDST